MARIKLLTTDGHNFVARHGTGNDNCQRGTGNKGKIRTKSSGLRCAIALRVAVAEFVRGPVTVLRETP